MNDESNRRAAIDSVAKSWREHNARQGNPISQSEARERVSEAVRKGDQKRNNDNR